jgi:hypothetical protein
MSHEPTVRFELTVSDLPSQRIGPYYATQAFARSDLARRKFIVYGRVRLKYEVSFKGTLYRTHTPTEPHPGLEPSLFLFTRQVPYQLRRMGQLT